MNNIICITGGSFTIPTDTTECREVIWSEGKSCRKCPLKECYRNGWLKSQVTADNKKIVAARMEELRKEWITQK
jgi:hypothetical protein